MLSGIASNVAGMTTYVLLPGFWLGAWAWREVAADLRTRGHEVYPLSFTGLGERAHLASPEVDLETHVTDVLNLIHYEDLRDVVLVGHSYAGAVVVPSVADRVPERLSRLVFVDSGPLPDGMSQSEFTSPEERERNASTVRSRGDGWLLPPPPWAEIPGLPAQAISRLEALSVGQPWKTAISPVRLTGAWEKLPRLHIMCSFGESVARERAASGEPAFTYMRGDDWTARELPGSHWPMFEQPAALAEALA